MHTLQLPCHQLFFVGTITQCFCKNFVFFHSPYCIFYSYPYTGNTMRLSSLLSCKCAFIQKTGYSQKASFWANRSRALYPLSAKILWPGFSSSNNPLCSMVNLSLLFPENPGETKTNTPVKVSIATKYFTVVYGSYNCYKKISVLPGCLVTK